MLYAGQEFAQNGTSRDPGGSIQPQPLQWQNLDTPDGSDLFGYYSDLIKLRTRAEVLRSGEATFKLTSNAQKSIVFWRTNDIDQVVVAANFNDQDETIDIEFPVDGVWYEFTLKDTLEISGGMLAHEFIPASTARLYINNPEWLNIESDPMDMASSLQLFPNYPNPFGLPGSYTTIAFQLPLPQKVTLDIFNVTGQKVRTLLNDQINSGYHSITWDGKNDHHQTVSSGIYYYQLRTPDQTHQKKMVFIH